MIVILISAKSIQLGNRHTDEQLPTHQPFTNGPPHGNGSQQPSKMRRESETQKQDKVRVSVFPRPMSFKLITFSSLPNAERTGGKSSTVRAHRPRRKTPRGRGWNPYERFAHWGASTEYLALCTRSPFRCSTNARRLKTRGRSCEQLEAETPRGNVIQSQFHRVFLTTSLADAAQIPLSDARHISDAPNAPAARLQHL